MRSPRVPRTHRRIRTVLAAALLVVTGVALASSGLAQEKKGKSLDLKGLPAAVQKTVRENLKGGDIKNIGKEMEDGVEQYEIESTLNGTSRDFNVASDGRLLVVEEATTLDAIPAAAPQPTSKRNRGVDHFCKRPRPEAITDAS